MQSERHLRGSKTSSSGMAGITGSLLGSQVPTRRAPSPNDAAPLRAAANNPSP